MKYGYGRVSTTARCIAGTEGNSLEAQQKKLLEAGVPKENVVLEMFTGTKMDRPKFTELVDKLEAGDMLIVCKLDRFARSASEGVTLIKELLARGVSVNVLNMGLVENTPTGRLILNVMMSFAEYERDMIVTRLEEGKAAAREREGYREGRLPLEVPDFMKFYDKVVEGVISVTEACKQLGISRSKWYKLVKEV